MESWRKQLYLQHYGVSKLDGAKIGSGRYPLGSGENPRSERNYFDQIADKHRKQESRRGALYAVGAVGGAGLGVGAAMAVAAATGVFIPHLAILGLYVGAASSGIVITKGEQAINNIKHKKLKKVYEQVESDEKNLPKKTTKTTPEQDEKAVNPFYSTGKDVYTQNCAQCTVAYDLRRRGYDVSAKPTAKGMNLQEIKSMYKNPDKAFSNADKWKLTNLQNLQDKQLRKNEIEKWFKGFKEDGRYNLLVSTWGYGHSIVLEVEKGKPVIRNTQSGHNMTVESFINSEYASKMNTMMAVRIDNLKIDEANVSTMVEAGWHKKGNR